MHLIAEFYGCDGLEDHALIRQALLAVAKASGATILDQRYHEFIPQGLTSYVLLKESHISIHTWPEHGYAAVDVFTCGENMKPELALDYLERELNPTRLIIKKISRGRLGE